MAEGGDNYPSLTLSTMQNGLGNWVSRIGNQVESTSVKKRE